MKLTHLRKLRIYVSLVFFLAVTFLFLDFKNLIPAAVDKYLLFFQFIPSLLKFINIYSISAAGFIFIVALTFLYGRVYCSTVCPLGILQDIISRFSKKLNKKKYFRLLKDYKFLKYSLLIIAVISFLSSSLIAINLLDPYSNFGRILANLFQPLILLINNFFAFTFEKFNIYFLYPIEIKQFSFFAAGFSFFVLMLVGIMSFAKGRLFCNTVCPVGTLLGLVSKFSFYKIAIDEEKCNSCNLCTRNCKSGCIDKKNKTVDFSRCVACYNCISVCPSGGITYVKSYTSKNKIEVEQTDIERREVLSKTFFYVLGLAGFTSAQVKIIPKKENKTPIVKKYTVTPPGSKGLDNFTSSCTACHLCVSSCPTQVLQPSFLEYGFLGILEPYMDYKTSFCNFDCTICSDVCPSGAILPVGKDEKKTLQLGKANFIKENCIVEIEKTECGACSEHCPTKAVKMVPYKNLHLPEVKNEYCVGCGACEYACPTKPYKAIYVEGNPVHLTAQKMPEEKLKEKVDYKEDFPF